MKATPQTATTRSTDKSNRGFCCVHIGLPKTGTTMLQRKFFPRHPALEYLGKQTRRRGSNPQIVSVLKAIHHTTIEPHQIADYADRLSTAFASALDRGRIPTWSLEGISQDKQKYRTARAELIRAVFGPCKILITLRNPISLAGALYFQQLRNCIKHRIQRYATAQKRRNSPFRYLAPIYFDFETWLNEVLHDLLG